MAHASYSLIRCNTVQTLTKLNSTPSSVATHTLSKCSEQGGHDTSTNYNGIASVLFTVRLQRSTCEGQARKAHEIAPRSSRVRASYAPKDLLKAEVVLVVAELEKRPSIHDSQLYSKQLDAIDTSTTEAKAPVKARRANPHDYEFVNAIARDCQAVAVTEFEQRNQDIPDSQVRPEAAEVIAGFQKQLDDINAGTTETGALCLIRPSLRFKNEQLDAKSTTPPLKPNIVHIPHLTCIDPNTDIRPMTEYERDFWAERKGGIRMKGGVQLDMKGALYKRVAVETTVEQGLGTVKATGNMNQEEKLDDRRRMERSANGDRGLSLIVIMWDITFRPARRLRSTSWTNLSYSTFIARNCASRAPLSLLATLRSPNPHSATKVLKDVSLTIHPGDRAGLVGKNWEGKPTLIKLLTGIGELVPKKDSIEQHPRLRLGYFDQHSVGHTLQSASPSIDVDESAFLGSFGLHGRTAVNPISTLSGGQKVRLALAMVVYPASNLLVPDEVATHLDKDTIVTLIQALRKHTGAVLLVSHDRHFVRCVIESEHAVPRLGDSDGESDEGSDEDDDTGQSGKGTV
ncbi:hypothetical protein BDQ17DRAFT_1430890 [Cyathus striatus]|nr:hypothetical protein BDQ17DRAFT_1430890 [Cyathus striatus]